MIYRFSSLLAISALWVLLHACQPNRSQHPMEDLTGSTPVFQANPVRITPLQVELEKLRIDRCIDSSTLSYLIIDDTEDQPVILAAYHAEMLLIPASVQKLLVTTAALEILGRKVVRDVTYTNIHSHNGIANKLVKQIGQQVYRQRSFQSGCRAVLEFWQSKGVDMTGATMVDGSGRMYTNALSARQLVDVLYYMTTAPTFGAFYSSLPLSGISGTMKHMLNGTTGEGKIRAKTGTLASIKSLAGYASTTSGRKIIFAIIINNYTCRTKILKNKLENILIKMVEI